MRQSVMANAVTTGSSGVGFALRLVVIKEVLADRNICLVSDFYTNEGFQPGLNKRGDSSVWPQVGEQWLIDRSMGHWALKCKVTDTRPPAFNSDTPVRSTDMQQLVNILVGHGIIMDTSGAPVPITATGDRARMEPALGKILDVLTGQGLITDGTTGSTVSTLWTWQNITAFYNSWVTGHHDNPTLNPPLRIRRIPGNRVELNGWLQNGNTTTFTRMFDVPAAFIPPLDQHLVCFRNDLLGHNTVKILGTAEGAQAGQVQILSGTGSVANANLQVSGTYPLD
jgi:hypothetical protein